MELHLEKLVKDFAEVRALDTGDLTIQDGKLTGLLGPSGCGKSTLLYLISGLQSPTSGRIFSETGMLRCCLRKSGGSASFSRTTPSIPT